MARSVCVWSANWLAMGLVLASQFSNASAQEPVADQIETIEMRVTGTEVPSVATQYRLLPTANERTDGNAAVILLRLVSGENPLQPEITDAKFEELRRAAFCTDCDWEYPMKSGTLMQTRLPDLGVLQVLLRDSLGERIRTQIDNDDIDPALESIRAQLACGQHLGRAPFLLHQFLAVGIGVRALENLEELVQRNGAPNLYWALALLDDNFGNVRQALEYESVILKESLPSLGESLPSIGDEQWTKVAGEFSTLMISEGNAVQDLAAASKLQRNLVVVAKLQLPQSGLYTDEQLTAMDDIELGMRWILYHSDVVNGEIQAASALPAPSAIVRLQALKERISRLQERLGAPGAPYNADPLATYLATHRFARRLRLLQAAEALRHQAALSGSWPTSLRDCELPVPADPLTGLHFEYSVAGEQATIRTPSDTTIDASIANLRREYRLTLQ